MLTIYTKNNCPKCEDLKKILTEHKVEYETENISDNPQALKLARQIGGMGFPFVTFPDRTIFSGDLQAILEKILPKNEVKKDQKYFWGK